MKKVFIALLVLFGTYLNIYSQWINSNSPTSNSVLCFAEIGNNLFMGVSNEGVYLSTNNGDSWVLTSLNNKSALTLASKGTNLYAGTADQLYLTTDNGTTWNQIKITSSDKLVLSIAFIGANMFVGTSAGVYLSTNNGSTWVEVNNGLPFTYVKALMVKGTDLFAGTSDSGVYRSTNSGSTWTPANHDGQLDIYSLLTDGTNIYSGTYGNVDFSTNNGDNWIHKNNGIHSVYVYSLISKQDGSTLKLFAGSNDHGVYNSTNNGDNWFEINNGLTPKTVRGLFVNGNYLFAGTGNGVWRRLLSDVNLCRITVECNIQNAGVLSGAGTFDLGSSITLTATPNVGYTFINWTDNGTVVSLNPNYTFAVNNNRTLIANFSLTQFNINLTANPTNGGTTFGSGVYSYGSIATISASSNSGFTFTNWAEGSNIVSSNSSYVFNVTTDRDLVANFVSLPISPVAQQATSISQTSFRANWNSVSNATKYLLDVAIDEQFNNILSTFNNKDVGNVTSYLVNGLAVNSTFYFRVRAFNQAGTSVSSNTILVSTLPYAPSEPTALQATNLSQTSFTANWNQVSGTTGYYIDVAIDGSFTNRLTNFNNKDVGNVTSFTVTGLSTNFTYYYRVRAYNTGGTSTSSNTITVTLTTDVKEIGIDKPTAFNLFQNYPNPFNPTTKIQFSLPKDLFVKLNIYNSIGQELCILLNQNMPIGTYAISFDANDLPNGIYFYKIQTGEFSETKKMILMK